jgi:hypothetical protein
MATEDTAISDVSAARDWPLTSNDHLISIDAAQALIANYKPSLTGAYFTINTINSLINPANAGIRFYFTIHNNRLTVMLTGVKKIDIGKYEDLYNSNLAVSDSLTALSSDTNQSIKLNDAAICNKNYRTSSYFSDGCKGGMFGIDAILTIMKQRGCSGIRFYFGSAAAVKTIVLFGVDAAGKDITTYVGDQNCPCPNYCSSVNPLNS